jgi:hypothetical protein
MSDVNEQRARRQNFSDAKGGKAEDGQYPGGAAGSGRVISANDGEAPAVPSYKPVGQMLGADNDQELEGSSSPEIGIVKGSDMPTAPALEKGSADVPEPTSKTQIKGRKV